MTLVARALTTLTLSILATTTVLAGVADAETRVIVDDRGDSARIVYDDDAEVRLVVDPAERRTDVVRQTTTYGDRVLTVTVKLRALDVRRRGGTFLIGQIDTHGARAGFEVTLRGERSRFRWEGSSADPSKAPCADDVVEVDLLPARRAIRVAIPTSACLDDAAWVRTSTIVGYLDGWRAEAPEDIRYWLDGALTRGKLKVRQPFGGMGPKVHRG